ncbi:hypothetical protein DXG03_002704 [Asterophora parasitica]|uniref:Uncharacterized protein n=1 Tax=Asterophora parasitica TaxID=117018 RepID=A0A9P7G8L8_9AGAR|nr:hypothetical protein DXG03_002704 [Asterophora parasitica]
MASSVGSYISGPPLSSSSAYIGGSSSAATSSFSAMLPDNSQTGLEKVIQSRLVETFIAVTIPRLSMSPPSLATTPQPTSPLKSPTFSKSQDGSLSRKAIKSSPLSPSEKSTAAKARRDSAASRPPTRPPSSHVKSSSTSVVRTNGEVKRATQPSILVPLSPKQSSEPQTSAPNYFSPIHRPSTHPHFPIDARSNHFAADTDSSGHKMKVEVWGRVGSAWRENPAGKGKEKEVDGVSGLEWKILDEREIDLRHLVPFSQSVRLSIEFLWGSIFNDTSSVIHRQVAAAV